MHDGSGECAVQAGSELGTQSAGEQTEIDQASVNTGVGLLVSESGRIAIVETKLSYNPEVRRSVVAQTLEYASHLSEVADLPDLPPVPKLASSDFVLLDDVRDGLRKGDFLLIIAGDGLDPRAVRLSKTLLSRHALEGWDLALVDVAVYQRLGDEGEPKHLLVPHLRGALVAEQRHVLRVVVEGGKAKVSVEPNAEAEGPSRRRRQDEEAFARALPLELHPFFDSLRELRTRFPTFSWSPASASLVFRNREFNMLELYSQGEVRFRAQFFPKALGKIAAATYRDGLCKLFPEAMARYKYDELTPKKADQLLGLIEAALQAAGQSSPR
jgi:hypothetical protein